MPWLVPKPYLQDAPHAGPKGVHVSQHLLRKRCPPLCPGSLLQQHLWCCVLLLHHTARWRPCTQETECLAIATDFGGEPARVAGRKEVDVLGVEVQMGDARLMEGVQPIGGFPEGG